MAHLNPTTGLWEDDEDGPAPVQGGAVGAQAALPPVPITPTAPPPPPPAVEIGEPVMLSPEELAARNAAAGQLPVPASAQPAPVEPIPPSRVVTPAEAGNLAAIDANTAARVETQQQANQGANETALAKQQQADQEAADLAAHQAEKTRIESAAQERIASAAADMQADTQRYREMGIKDPAAGESFGHKILAAIAIGLGQYSASLSGGRNTALDIIQGATARNIQRQKDEIALAERKAQQSRENVGEERSNYDRDMKRLDNKHAALLENAATRWKQELARHGVPAAQIEGNKEIQKLEAEALQKRQGVLQSIRDDETTLAKAEIAATGTARVAQIRAAARGAGKVGAGGKAGPGGMDAIGQLQDYLQKNPGDNAGAYRLAGELGIKDPKLVKEAITQNKGDEGQRKDARQASIGLRAVEAIEKSGYTPTKAEIQKWLNNQKQVAQAQRAGEGSGIGAIIGGGLAGAAQGIGWLAQSEAEGLSEAGKDYFANVRRFMESIGRAQSGAAISNSEWTNFLNQYGPNSKGGLAAAREYLSDQFKVSGVAGRQLDAGDKKDKKGPSTGEKAQALQWARANPNDPRAKKILQAIGGQ